MGSHANQALQTILCQDQAAVGESPFSKVLGRYVGQSLASEAEAWQVLRRDIVRDVCEKLIRECQEPFGVFPVRS